MTNISSAYDALVTRMTALYPNHLRIPNPYSVEQNSEGVLKQGWGVAFSTGINSNRNLNCKLSVQRSFTVVLTRKVYALESDASAKGTAEKTLFEDQKLLISDVEADPSLGNSTAVTRAMYTSDNGLEFIFGEKDNFLKLETTIEVEYFEDLV